MDQLFYAKFYCVCDYLFMPWSVIIKEARVTQVRSTEKPADVQPSQDKYRQTSDISRTKLKNLNTSRFGLQFSLPNLPKRVVKERI